MKIQLEYPHVRELDIQKIEVVDISKQIVGVFFLQKDENIWHAEVNILSEQFVYQFLLNDRIYLNDPYASDYIIQDDEVWSIRYREEDKTFTRIVSTGVFDIVISNQMNCSVQASKMHKRFYRGLDKRVNVGIEVYSITGVHELCVVWGSPDKRIYHVDYKPMEPQQEEEAYGILVWFRLLLDEVEDELLRGIWTVRILLDGVLIGMEWFQAEENIMGGL